MRRKIKCANGNTVERFYDRATRSSVTIVIDVTGNQVGDAFYDGNPESAAFSMQTAIADNDGERIELTLAQRAMLDTAKQSPDGTVLAIGFGRHGYSVQVSRNYRATTHSKATAMALEKRGLIEFVKHSDSWGTVYRITPVGIEQ